MRRTALVLCLSLCAAGAALADSLSQDEARDIVKRGDIRPLAEAIAKVEKEYGGRLLDAELERSHGKYVYEIKLMTKDGWRRKLYLDAKSLDVLKDTAKQPKDIDKDKD